MEIAGHSSYNLNDFEFKQYIPKSQLEKVIKKFEDKKTFEKNARMYDNLHSVSSVGSNYDEDYTNIDAVGSIIYNSRKSKGSSKILKDVPRRFNVEDSEKVGRKFSTESQASFNSDETETNTQYSSIHIDEVVNVTDVPQESNSKPSLRVENFSTDISEYGNDDFEVVSDFRSDNEEDEIFNSEILNLRNQIEHINGTMANNKTHNVMPYDEKLLFRSILNKTERQRGREEREFICDNNVNYIDKKFDFLDDEFSNFDISPSMVQCRRTQETKKEPKKKGIERNDSTNDNNVHIIPKTDNQVSKNQLHQRHGGKSNVRPTRPERPERPSIKSSKPTLNADEKSQVSMNIPIKQKTLPNESSSSQYASILRKVTSYQENICQYLHHLRAILEDPVDILDISDLRKRQKRSIEFTSRFARNHLYTIGRMADELRLMPDNPIDVATKVNLLFQLIMQAAQTYLKNVQMFIYNSHPDKLLVLVDFIINSTKICFDRKVFDKKDNIVLKMLRKCSNLKDFMQTNETGLVNYDLTRKNRNREMEFQMDDFEDEYQMPRIVPKKSKSSPYDKIANPYNIPIPKMRSSRLASSKGSVSSFSKVSSRQNLLRSSKTRVEQPVIKKSTSNVSTVIQKENEKEIHLKTIKSQPEKPLEDEKPIVEKIEKPKEMIEIMEMLQNIAIERINEMLLPILSQLMPMRREGIVTEETEEIKAKPCAKSMPSPSLNNVLSNAEPSNNLTSSSSHVKGEIEMTKAKNYLPTSSSYASSKSFKNKETIQRISKNVQYVFIESDNEEPKSVDTATSMIELTATSKVSKPSSPVVEMAKNVTLPLKNNDDENLKELNNQNEKMILKERKNIEKEENIRKLRQQAIIEQENDEKEENIKKLRQQAMKERVKMIESMSENPLYVNDHIAQPWKAFADISDRILDDMLKNIIDSIDFGEKSFVDNFLQHELAC